MVAVRLGLSKITENMNELIHSVKRSRETEWIKTQHQTVCCFQEAYFTLRRHIDWKWRYKGRGPSKLKSKVNRSSPQNQKKYTCK
jgi:hypothetical protein